jgi:pyruvate/2-oxoglutarate dehydrogenase complex dihydrolipoamide dehydrogenase (E3) component
MNQTFDAIIVGAGQAGPPLAGRLTAAGWKVALVERHLFGGTCVNTGCMPTKALVACARAAHVARRGADFGVMIGGSIDIDMQRVQGRAETVRTRARQGIEDWLRTMPGLTVIEGHARFTAPQVLRVANTTLEAPHVFLNVGGRANVPDLPGIGDIDYLTNTSILELRTLPEHLVVIGGSYIGLEFAQMYRRFGARVTVVEKGPRLIAREDEDVSAAVQGILEDEGIVVRTGAECIAFGRHPDGVAVSTECTEGPPTVIGTHVLLAIGRTPNTGDLGLDLAGVATDDRGYIVVDDRLQSNVAGIWALGDCNGRGAFTHTSYNDFEIVAANLLDGAERRVDDRIAGYALYIDPPLGRVGQTETQARRSGRPVAVATRPMTRVGRAIEKDETKGFIKIVADPATRRILGAAILGTDGDEAIHGILDAINADVPWPVLQWAVPIHPTVSELIPTVLGELEPPA